MKIKIAIFLLSALFLLQLPANCQETPQLCLLVAQLQEPSVLSSRKEISKLVNLTKIAGAKTIFMQVYRADQAWFYSTVSDSAPYNRCFKNLREDPFGLLIKQSHAKGIKVYAWLNLLSLNTNNSAFILKKYGKDVLTRNPNKKKKIKDYKIDNQYFLEPGDLRVRNELVSLVEELLRAYPDMDGILFDYIRYPDVKPNYGYTKMNIKRFKDSTGAKKVKKESLIWKNWKRKQVNELLALLVKKARSMRPGISVGATGCAPYIRAYYEAYQDWPSWINGNLVDFVFLMSYPDNTNEFNKDIRESKEKVKDFKKVCIGVPAYKLVHSPGVFMQEFKIAELSGAGGCGIFHYGSLLDNPDLINILSDGKSK